MKYWSKSYNVLYGCTKCRAGCKNCWAESMSRRMQGNDLLSGVVDERGEWTGKIVYRPDRLDMPRHWKKPQVVAVNWMGDTFHENVPPEVWPALYKVMSETPQHRYLVLTKRYALMDDVTCAYNPLENVYLGVTISNKKDADDAYREFIPCFYQDWPIWVSYEPALEIINWSGFEFVKGFVCGGESGVNARPMPPEAATSARDFCVKNDIPFTFKQWGPRGAGRVLEGREWFEFPSKE